MKKRKTLLSVATLALLLGSATACGGQKGAADNKTVQLYLWNSGLDVDWMKKIISDFNASQDEFKVEATYSSNATTIIQTLAAGSGNYYDLYFTILNTSQYDDDFIDMDWILNEKVNNEPVTVGEKYYSSILKGIENSDGTHRFLNYGNNNISIVYNKDLLDQTSFKDTTPRTTEELKILSTELNAKNIPTWLFFNDDGSNGYWNYVSDAWAAQYNGVDYYNNTLLQLGGADATKEEAKAFFIAKDGRYKALEAMESLITNANTHAKCASNVFTDVQNLFLDGEAALNINGSWLMKEYSKTGNSLNYDFRMMKLPVISSIVETFEGADASMDDETLSKIIAEVDEGKTSSTKCSSETFARIKEARNVMFNNAPQQYVFIPSYSNCIDGSKEFLRYFYSDKGTKTFVETTGLPSSVRLTDESIVDTSNLSSWSKQIFERADDIVNITLPMNRSKYLIKSTLNLYANCPTAQQFRLPNGNNKTAEQIWQTIENKINGTWDDYGF